MPGAALTLRPAHGVAAGAGLAGGAWAVVAGVPSPFLQMSVVLAMLLGLLARADILTLRLPDVLTGTLAVAGLAMSVAFLPPMIALDHALGGVSGLAGAVAFMRLAKAITRRDMLGGGDAKLIGAAGLWLGWQALPALLLIAAVGGVGLALLGDARRPLPFGVAIAAATWLLWLYGAPSLG